MANVVIDPNMGFSNPVPTVDPGPDWAFNIFNSLSTIGAHNHAPGSGVQINPDGIDINADLPFNSNNATLLRSSRYVSQSSPIPASSPDLSCVYVSLGELYYNDGAGNQVKLTSGGSPAGGAGTITGLPSGTASANFSAASGTFIFQQATSTAANMDIGTLVLRYPGSYPTPAGNYISIQAPTSLATGYSFTLPNNTPAFSNALLTSSTSGTIGYTDLATVVTPVGQISMYGGTSAPLGYLICDGTSYLRSSYPNLFSVIGTAFGTADSTHFNVPDLRGQFVRGVDNGAGRDPDTLTRTAMNAGGNTGDNIGSVESDAMQGHLHNTIYQRANVSNSSTGGVMNPDASSDTKATSSPISDGVNGTPRTSSETRPINAYLNFIIKT